jgi:hypothetical protein
MRRRVLAGLFATFAAAACQSGTEPPQPREPGQLIVSASLAANPEVSTVVVEVTAADISTPLVFNLTLSGGMAASTVTVPAGSRRKFTVRAYNASGIETHRGSKEIDVREGTSTTPVVISLLSLAGSQPIEVRVSSHRIELAIAPSLDPVTGPLVVAVGQTVTLVATIKDAAGATVTPGAGELQWASNKPALAIVSGGVVSGVMAGSDVTIMATFLGVGVSATVNVTP